MCDKLITFTAMTNQASISRLVPPNANDWCKKRGFNPLFPASTVGASASTL